MSLLARNHGQRPPYWLTAKLAIIIIIEGNASDTRENDSTGIHQYSHNHTNGDKIAAEPITNSRRKHTKVVADVPAVKTIKDSTCENRKS